MEIRISINEYDDKTEASNHSPNNIYPIDVIFNSIYVFNNKEWYFKGHLLENKKIEIKCYLKFGSNNFNFKSLENRTVKISGYKSKDGWISIFQMWWNSNKIFEINPSVPFEKSLLELLKSKNKNDIDNYFK